MDSKAIETLSIEAVKSSIVMSDYLSPLINSDDTEPSWDGYIYIYNKKGRKKDDMMGRVPVQVKGHASNDLSKNEISYSMKMSDLNNYLNDAGVILFVVYIKNSELNQIYYCSLLPVKLKRLIHEAAGQKTKTVRLKKFPDDANQKREILVNFFEDRQRQASFVKTPLLSIEDLQNNGELNEVKAFVTAVGRKNPQTALLDKEVYLYVQAPKSSIPQPLDVLPLSVAISGIRKATISVQGTEWYSEYEVVKSKSHRYFMIGKSFRVDLPTDTDPAKFTYKESNLLRVRVKDLGFFLACIEYSEFYINDIKIPFEKENFDFTKFNIAEQKDHLIYLKKVLEVLELLGYKGDIDTKKLSQEQDRSLYRLVTAFIEKKPVQGLKLNLPTMWRLNIADAAAFELFIVPDAEEPEAYRIYDFFDIEIPIAYTAETGDKVPISQYALLSAKDLCELTNLRTEKLLPSLKKYSSEKDAFEIGNDFLLKLLEAYDLSNGLRLELIEVAIQFSEWIKETASNDEEKLFGKLNFLQTIKRVREYSADEIEELWEMVEDEALDIKDKVAAYLLLGVQPSAQHLFEKLDDEQQNELKNYPIFHFWKGD